MYKKHRDVLALDDDDAREPAQPIATDSYEFSDCDSETAPQLVETEQDERRRNALFLMKATAVCKVSKCSLDQLIGDISLFLDEKVQSLKKEVMATLHEKIQSWMRIFLHCFNHLLWYHHSEVCTLSFCERNSTLTRWVCW